jgi:hypothetical protein
MGKVSEHHGARLTAATFILARVPIALESRPRHAENVAFRGLRDGGVLLHLDTGQYHGLNPTAVVIWELLDGDRTLIDVTRALHDRLDDPPEDLEGYVSTFVGGLHERGLVVL